MRKTHDLYRHFDKDNRLLYVGESISTMGRLAQHRSGSGWYDEITNVTIEKFPTKSAAKEAESIAIRSENPLYNKAGRQPGTSEKATWKVPTKEKIIESSGIREYDWSLFTEGAIEGRDYDYEELDFGLSVMRPDDEDCDLYLWEVAAARIWSEQSGLKYCAYSINELVKTIRSEMRSYFGSACRRDLAQVGSAIFYLCSFYEQDGWTELQPAFLIPEGHNTLCVVYKCEKIADDEWDSFLFHAGEAFQIFDQFGWTLYFGFHVPPTKFDFLPLYFHL